MTTVANKASVKCKCTLDYRELATWVDNYRDNFASKHIFVLSSVSEER